MDQNVLDDIIRRLLDVRESRSVKQVQLSEAEIRQLCQASKDIFVSQPNLLELEAPIKICGTSRNKKLEYMLPLLTGGCVIYSCGSLAEPLNEFGV